jgi:Spy/CpxP family protein refolding chaperone
MTARAKASSTPLRGYLDLLALSDQQKADVEKIRERFLPRVARIREQLRRCRATLADQLFEEPMNRSRALAILAKISRLQSALELEVFEHILQERQLLTAAQRRQFHRVIAQQFRGGGLGIHDVR